MNKFFNALLLLIFIPTVIFTVIVGLDIVVPIQLISTVAAQEAIFIVLGVMLLFVIIRKSIKRWTALRLVNQTNKYKWSSEISKSRIHRVYLYTILEAFVYAAFGLGTFYVSNLAWMPLIAMTFAFIDNITFMLYGGLKHKYRIGMTSKALLSCDREVVLIFFKGLRKVHKHQQTLYFDFKDNLQLHFPMNLIPQEKHADFFNHLKKNVDETRVYFQNDL